MLIMAILVSLMLCSTIFLNEKINLKEGRKINC
jgi:hypothetical protein